MCASRLQRVCLTGRIPASFRTLLICTPRGSSGSTVLNLRRRQLATKSSEHETVTPKKRGRPKKADSSVVAATTPLPAENETNHSDNTHTNKDTQVSTDAEDVQTDAKEEFAALEEEEKDYQPTVDVNTTDRFVSGMSTELKVTSKNISDTINLFKQENTIHFLARYRKEITGNLDENSLRHLQQQYEYHAALDKRKSVVLSKIKEQNKLTQKLNDMIIEAKKLPEVEDLYAPYKKKKSTLAAVAIAKGLLPAAEQWLKGAVQAHAQLNKFFDGFISKEKAVNSRADVLTGIKHIIAEKISETPGLKEELRQHIATRCKVTAKEISVTSKQKEKSKELDKDNSPQQQLQQPQQPHQQVSKKDWYKDYLEFQGHVTRIQNHQVLALNRAEKEKVVTLQVAPDNEADILNTIQKRFLQSLQQSTQQEGTFHGNAPTSAPNQEWLSLLSETIQDSYQRLIEPSLVTSVRNMLTERAEAQAIQVFAKNLERVLLTPPVRDRRVLAMDPGYAGGCKIAVVDEYGNLLDTAKLHIVPAPHHNKTSQAHQRQENMKALIQLITKHNIDLIAVGNGTASRETEEFVSETLATIGNDHSENNRPSLQYTIVNENGASVYSASKAAQEEFPEMDVTLRSAVSLARRVQDPLSEIVKIPPKSIGVGMYQHDVKEKNLNETLDFVVKTCVNRVGVNLNTASAYLLRHVSGLSKLQAQRIIEFRQSNGKFDNRQQLLQVKSLGKSTFTQAAGFLKIVDGDNPLDSTAIHPESYEKTLNFLKKMGIKPASLADKSTRQALQQKVSSVNVADASNELGIGVPTLSDIIENLKKPGLDPRESLPKPQFRKEIMKLEDLQVGHVLTGKVTNVVDFGAFVDVGLKQSGLIHRSQLNAPSQKGKAIDPFNVIAVGDDVTVKVVGVDSQRGRIQLSLQM